MTTIKNEDWEAMAQKHEEYRVFLEFAETHKKTFYKWLSNKIIAFREEASK